MAQDQIGQPIQLSVPVGSSDQVRAVLPQDLTSTPEIVEDPALDAGQAHLQVGVARQDVDCSALLETIAEAFEAYLFEAKEALSNE